MMTSPGLPQPVKTYSPVQLLHATGGFIFSSFGREEWSKKMRKLTGYIYWQRCSGQLDISKLEDGRENWKAGNFKVHLTQQPDRKHDKHTPHLM